MKILDKLKNFFYDEEEIEVPKEPVKKVPPKEEAKEPVVSKKPKKEEKQFEIIEDVDDIVSERELFKSESTFKFPIIFEDDDFTTEKKKNKGINVLDVENTKVKEQKNTVAEKKNFKPSPIISPIYGVLGQNYEKDLTAVREDNFLNLYDKDENIDIDSVIGRAYGRNEKENIKEPSAIIPEEKVLKTEDNETIDLFKDINEEDSILKIRHREIDVEIDTNATIEKEEAEEEFESDYKLADEVRLKSIDELLESTDEQDFYKLVDSMYENIEENEEE